MLIEHADYGRGEIRKRRYGGFELYVAFDDGISRWVRNHEVRTLSENPILTKPMPTKPKITETQMKARQILEALRLGIVPELYAEEFTFGRDEEISKIKTWLANSEGSLILIGEYGSGKTHLLHNVFYSAVNDNWAAAMISLDPNEQAFHKPKAIYEYIIRSFRFKDQNGQHGDFREFLRTIATNPTSHKLSGHKYLSKMVRRIKDDGDNEDFWEWIEGKPEANNIVPKMYEKATCANIYCYILSGIGWAAKNIMGLNGLTILFDEAESVDPGWFTHYQYNKAKNLTKGIVFTSKNDKILIEDCEQKFYEHPL